MSFATADSTGSRLPRIHRLRRKLEIGPHADGTRFAAAGETAGLARRLPVLRLRGAAAVPEAFVFRVLARISGHVAILLQSGIRVARKKGMRDEDVKVDKVNPTNQFHPYQPVDSTPVAEREPSRMQATIERVKAAFRGRRR